MKKIILFFLMLLAPVVCLAYFNVSEWKYYKEIGKLGATDLTKFFIDDEVFTNAKNDLSDLRIVGEDGKEVPYLMFVGKDQEKIEVISPQLLNNSYVAGKFSSVILDFSQPGKLINRLRIITSTENFQRNVKISGSDDRQNWQTILSSGYIFDYTDKKASVKTQNTTLDFSQSLYRYYLLEVADTENSPVSIDAVQTFNYVKQKSKELERQPRITVNKNPKNNDTDIVVDLEAKGIPTNKIKLSVKDQNFNRSILVFSGNNNSDWRYLGSAYIFRFNTEKFSGENQIINFPETTERYIKLSVQNKDNQPLDGFTVLSYSTYREILFQAENTSKIYKKYYLYYGNNKAVFPEYDLSSYIQYLDNENAHSASLSAQADNNQYVPEIEPKKPLSERSPYFLPVALTISCLLVLFLVFQFFKKK